MVRTEHGSEQHICVLCITGVAILQLIKSRYLESKSKAAKLAVSKAGAAAL